MTTCATCSLDYRPESHCSGCHLTWYGLEECHCPTCHEHFSSDSGFLMHQTSDACDDPAALTTEGGRPKLKQVERRGGLTWVKSDERAYPQEPVRGVGGGLGAESGAGAGALVTRCIDQPPQEGRLGPQGLPRRAYPYAQPTPDSLLDLGG